MKISFVTWLKRHNPKALECQVENFMKSKGFRILWTPPYCPNLQPIKAFWGCGKNHVSLYNYEGNKISDVINLLREGWYGTRGNVELGDDHIIKKPVNTGKLWKKCIRYANEISVKLCQGIEGSVGSLTIDESYVPEPITLPIDTLVSDLARESSEEEEEGVSGEDNVTNGVVPLM